MRKEHVKVKLNQRETYMFRLMAKKAEAFDRYIAVREKMKVHMRVGRQLKREMRSAQRAITRINESSENGSEHSSSQSNISE
jgi:hypothetical protein